jgi:hypothetical protein
VNPPDLTGWDVWCDTCGTHRHVVCREERDIANGEIYYDYVCAVCFSIVLNIYRSNPHERGKPVDISLN